jgi:alpha-amylase/alpha-mannosidase (GH57 family)
MNRYLCIHGHFYQPPRENAWLEEVELQDSAYPYHDWNERITAECYFPNTVSRILDDDRRIVDIVSNYSKISFNFGPTLLAWMERHAPEVHQAVIDADRESRKRFSGHGSALAQVYNHMIMPLANLRDKRTQVIWGIRDFEHRFGRRPEGMWLAETAVDLETLEVLSELDIAFTILAPRQAGRVRRIGGRRWRDVKGARIDPRMPYLCRLPSGRAITLFFYDGPISQDIAFGGLLNSGVNLANRLVGAFVEGDQSQLVHIATDGETYGHHHRFGDMALAYCLYHIETNNLAKLTVYGEYLEKFPPTQEVEIIENTSWSCAHGVERWKADCGCSTGREGWVQSWRAPLRIALNWLRDEAASIYERETAVYLNDPWQARNDYIDVILDRSPETVASFFSKHASRDLLKGEHARAFRLLEMQRHAMLMFTSCGWFFDEISGIETTQILTYAARAIQLAEKTTGGSLEPTFLKQIEEAPSNIVEHGNAEQVYVNLVKPAMVDLMRVGAHYAVSSLFEDYPETTSIYAYQATRDAYEFSEAGRQKLAIGRVHFRSSITWAETTVSFAVLHLGDHNLLGGVREFAGAEAFEAMSREIGDAFRRSNLPEIIRLMDTHFQTHNYSLWHLFRDGQRKVWAQILRATLEEVEESFRHLYDHHFPIMLAMREHKTPIPKALATTAEFTLNADLRRALGNGEIDIAQLKNLVTEVGRWAFDVDRTTLGFIATQKTNALMKAFLVNPSDPSPLKDVEDLLKALEPLALSLDMSKAQNIIFSTGKTMSAAMREGAKNGDQAAREWIEQLDRLGDYLRVRSI